MTPEQAREMLDRVKEGCPLPWEIFALETIEEDPREVKNVRCSEPGCDGHLAYSMDYDGTTEIDPDAIELVAAAPALAELVANMRYEYAVQVFEEGWWRTLGLRGTYKQAVALANLWRGDTCRVARRLATDWEVVE